MADRYHRAAQDGYLEVLREATKKDRSQAEKRAQEEAKFVKRLIAKECRKDSEACEITPNKGD